MFCCSGYGIAAQALTAVVRAHDGRGPETILTNSILQELDLCSPDELIGYAFQDLSVPFHSCFSQLVVVRISDDLQYIERKIVVNCEFFFNLTVFFFFSLSDSLYC